MAVHIARDALKQVARRRETADALAKLGEAVADNIRDQGIRVEGEPGDIALPVKVFADMTSEGARVSVEIDHPSGKAVQAKHGVITRAAAAAGLRVQG